MLDLINWIWNFIALFFGFVTIILLAILSIPYMLYLEGSDAIFSSDNWPDRSYIYENDLEFERLNYEEAFNRGIRTLSNGEKVCELTFKKDSEYFTILLDAYRGDKDMLKDEDCGYYWNFIYVTNTNNTAIVIHNRELFDLLNLKTGEGFRYEGVSLNDISTVPRLSGFYDSESGSGLYVDDKYVYLDFTFYLNEDNSDLKKSVIQFDLDTGKWSEIARQEDKCDHFAYLINKDKILTDNEKGGLLSDLGSVPNNTISCRDIERYIVSIDPISEGKGVPIKSESVLLRGLNTRPKFIDVKSLVFYSQLDHLNSTKYELQPLGRNTRFSDYVDLRLVEIENDKITVIDENLTKTFREQTDIHPEFAISEFYRNDESKIIIFSVITGSHSGYPLYLYDIEEGKFSAIPNTSDRINRIRYSPDKTHAIFMDSDGKTIFLLDVITGKVSEVETVYPPDTLVKYIDAEGMDNKGHYGWVNNSRIFFYVFNLNEKIYFDSRSGPLDRTSTYWREVDI